MSARALGRPTGARSLTVPVADPPRPVTAGTYRSPEKPPRDHSAREARRTVARAEAARKRAKWREPRIVEYDERLKTGPTPKRDTVRQDRYGAR